MLQVTIAGEINSKHEIMVGFAKRGIETAIEIGLLLQKQKEALPHGEWGKWVDGNLSFGDQQARKYMQIADNRGLLENQNHGSDLGINEALKEIRKLKAADREPDPLDDLFSLAESLGEKEGFDTRQFPKVLNQIKDLAGQNISRIREWETTLRNAMKTWAEGRTLSDDEKAKVKKALNWHQEMGW